MKRIINSVFAVIIMILLLVLSISIISVYLKWPMYLSGYSSLFTTQFNSGFIVFALISLLVSFLFLKKQRTDKKIWKLNLILSAILLIGQLIFMQIMLNTASKYDVKVSLLPTLKGYVKPLNRKKHITI